MKYTVTVSTQYEIEAQNENEAQDIAETMLAEFNNAGRCGITEIMNFTAVESTNTLPAENLEDDERLQAEDAKVLEVLKEEFPAAEDWNVNDNEEAEILDKDGNIICKISTDRLTKIYNSIEA